MDVAEFIAACPRVFHMASALAWPSIQQHGLLSTAGLLDLYGVEPDLRREIMTRRRAKSINLNGPGLAPAVIRDQKPMKFLMEKIEPDASVEDFLVAINSRVFFWPNRDRLERLRNAKEYRGLAQVVLHINTQTLVERHANQIELCRFNSGAITQRNHPLRSRESWLPIDQYPYTEYQRRYGSQGALAEVTVLDSVPDLLELAVAVEHVRP